MKQVRILLAVWFCCIGLCFIHAEGKGGIGSNKNEQNSTIEQENTENQPVHQNDTSDQQDNESDQTRKKVFTYLKDPKGLNVQLSLGSASFQTLFGAASGSVFLTKTNLLFLLHTGITIDQSFIDLRISPYFGSTSECLYIEGISGIWFANQQSQKKEREESVQFYPLFNTYFYGRLLSFTQPLFEIAMKSDSSEMMNAGLGITSAGAGFTFGLGLNILNTATCSFSGFIEIGAILPYQPIFDLGIYGPDIEVQLPNQWGKIYFRMLPWKLLFNLCRYELGYSYQF